MKNILKISIIQSDIAWLNKQKNLEMYSDLINKIESTNIVFLPEMFDTGFYIEPNKLNKTEKNRTLEWMKKTSSNKNISIGGSSIIDEDNKFYNRFFFVKPDKSVEFYNKRHLFKHAGELNEYSRGNSNTIVILDNWRIDLQICYDLRFPVWSRNRNDYDLLIYLANWPERRNDAWKTLLKARAIENQAYVIGVNRVGNDGNNINYPGKSLIINPKGEIIYEAKENEQDIYTVELDFENLMKIRQKFPVLEDKDEFLIV